MATKKTSIGGQALIEGIMMRGPTATAVYAEFEVYCIQARKKPRAVRGALDQCAQLYAFLMADWWSERTFSPPWVMEPTMWRQI